MASPTVREVDHCIARLVGRGLYYAVYVYRADTNFLTSRPLPAVHGAAAHSSSALERLYLEIWPNRDYALPSKTVTVWTMRLPLRSDP